MAEKTVETDSRSTDRRPTKRARTYDPSSQQGSKIEALFANPDKALEIPIGPAAKALGPPPEIVTNVQGSSAGAGSGEFHVYKASRRREYERLRAMDEEVEREKADQEWQERQEALKQKDNAKLSKNRARREKQKARQAKSKAGVEDGKQQDDAAGALPKLTKKKLVPVAVSSKTIDAIHEEQNGSNGVAADEDGITFLEDG